jgi:hypothetical protein
MVLTVSFALSPETWLFCLRRRRDAKHRRQLDICLGMSGPHDFAVREHAARQAAQPRPLHSDPTSVTVAKRPSFGLEQNRNIFQGRPSVKCQGPRAMRQRDCLRFAIGRCQDDSGGADLTFAPLLPRLPHANVKSKAPLVWWFATAGVCSREVTAVRCARTSPGGWIDRSR